MTDYKPFRAEPEESEVDERTVAAVLSIPSRDEDPAGLAWRDLEGGSLAAIALRMLARVEVEERWLLDTSPEAASLYEQVQPEGIRLLRQGDRSAVQATHLALIGPFHPFLRPSSVEEAVRLFQMRPDIASLTTCVKHKDALLDERGERVIDEQDERVLWRPAHAFEIVPARLRRRSTEPQYDPYPFELSAREAFLVDSEFELGLYAAWLGRAGARGDR